MKLLKWKTASWHLRGDLSSFRFFDFLDDELLDVDRDELRSFFEFEPFDRDGLDFELALLPIPNLLDNFDNDLLGDRKFLCLWTSLSWWSPILLLLLTCDLFVVLL